MGFFETYRCRITTKVVVASGLLIAMQIIFTRFFSVQFANVRIGFGFLPIAMAGMLFGPVVASIVGALSDIVGFMINPMGGGYFPGFTVSAALSGLVYGLFLYRKPGSLVRTCLAVMIISLFINVGLNTLWLYMMTNEGSVGLILPRIIKNASMFPVQVSTIFAVWHLVGKRVEPALGVKTN